MKIKFKLILLTTSASILISVLTNLYYINSQKNKMEADFNKKISDQSLAIANTISIPLNSYDRKTINSISEAYIKDDDIKFISIEDYYEGVISQTSTKSVGKLIEVYRPIKIKDNEIGSILLKYSKENYINELKKYTVHSLRSLIITVMIQFILLSILSRHLINPIKKLTYMTKQLTEGVYLFYDDLKRNDEIGDLYESFNSLSNSLTDKEELIKLHQNNLERIINERTDKLRESQNKLIEKAKMASLGSLVVGVAHEINTPLGVSLTTSSFLQDETKTIKSLLLQNSISREKFNQYINTVSESSDLLFSSLTKASLTINSFKEISVNNQNKSLTEFKLLEYIKTTINKISSEGKNYRIDYSDNDFIIRSDPIIIGKIVSILFRNSSKHAFYNNHGLIKINIKKNNDIIEIRYSDNGKGIENKYLEKIFDPFFTTKRGQENIGLGLSILYNLVTVSLNGHVSCFSKMEEGTEFIISFPDITI